MLASAAETLGSGGYTAAQASEGWPENTLLFEDDYGIVSIAAFSTWGELARSWPDEQARLIELMTKFIRKNEPKAAEAYLVLLTPMSLSRDDLAQASSIRDDTNRARKLVATGDDLHNLSDIREVLLPLLPVPEVTLEADGAFHALQRVLIRNGIDDSLATALVDAYRDQQPLMRVIVNHREDGDAT